MAAEIKSNQAFARVMADAGISRKRLAFEVRARALRNGKNLATDHNSVRRWLEGMQPSPEPASYVAAVLSERLGRAVTPAALGFVTSASKRDRDPSGSASGGSVAYPAGTEEATAALAHVALADSENEHVEALRTWDEYASPTIISGFLFDQPPQGGGRAGGEPVDATAIRRTTVQLMNLDFQLGGGHSRRLLLSFLRDQVLPVLDSLTDNQAKDDIYSATAELAQMLGWSAYDSGRHGAAQRYFVHGLRLARAAGDHLLGGFLLSSLSHQANYLGHFRQAAQLARAGQHEAAVRGSGRAESMLLAYEARALASSGDRAGCALALHRAEVAFDRARSSDDPEWLDFFDAAELAGEAAHCFRDLREPDIAVGFCAGAILSPSTPPRTRAFIGLVSAMNALNAGNLDEAVSVATTAVGEAGSIDSNRYRRYVSDFVRATTARHRLDARTSELVSFTAPLLERGIL